MKEQLEGLLHSGQFKEVLEIAGTYFDQLPSPSSNALWVVVAACRAAAAERLWGHVVKWAEKGRALNVRDHESQGHIELRVGVAYLHLGDVYRASESLDLFQSHAAATPRLSRLVPFGLFNKALSMRCMRRYDDEVRFFTQAAAQFAKQSETERALQCWLEIAWAHLLQEHPQLAYPHLVEVTANPKMDNSAELQIDCEISWALYHTLAGNSGLTQSICEENLTKQHLEPHQKADTLWILARVAKGKGDLSLASSYAAEALENAKLDYWPLQIERIESLLRLTKAN